MSKSEKKTENKENKIEKNDKKIIVMVFIETP